MVFDALFYARRTISRLSPKWDGDADAGTRVWGRGDVGSGTLGSQKYINIYI